MSRPPHRVVYTHGGGRLGNQVLRFIHWMAWARAHEGEVEVLNLAFWPFADYFESWRQHPGCVFPLRRSRADGIARRLTAIPRIRAALEGRNRPQKAVQAAARWLPRWSAYELDIADGEKIDLDDAAFLSRVRGTKTTACSGWRIASWPLVAKQEAELREYFKPAAEFGKVATDFIGKLRESHEVLIGVYIRQSDYQVWDDGRFYFSSTRYREWMEQVMELYRGKRAGFVVASEVHQEPGVFVGLPCFFATGTLNSGGHWFESWVELSLCDVIVTPPSTFSATAAFLGDKPLWPVVHAEQTMAFEQIIEDGLTGAASHPEFSRSVK